MKKNIKNEDDKNNIINGLIMNPEFYSDIDDVTREKLIEKLFNYNINDNNPVIVLVAAPVTTTTSKEIAKILLDKGISFEVEHEYLYSPIHYTATIGNKELFT
ncbi:hypothetical protein [Rickettsia gravesii]|uniref:hypothetical protein n=1 Tax=Rickettsia gravesii TaxID=354585 RepID=UPI00037EDE32|nr:hypothetical protein [Rickettsia gravesii]